MNNSCFAASSLQFIGTIPLFVDSVSSDLESNKTDSQIRLAVEHLLIALMECGNGELPPESPYTFGNNDDCHQQLRIHVAHAAEYLVHFHPTHNRQQDVHAFLGLLFALIWNLVLPLQSADVRTEAEASTLEFPFVPQAMSKVGSQVLHSISCSNCQYGNLQVCIDISSWTVSVSNTQGLQGAMQSLFATESNVGNCTACSGMACLKRRKQLITASQYIMIHLSLFTFNAATQQPSKLQCFYGCPSHFTIEDCFVRSPNKVLHLQLMSIILHRGSSTLSGHYVCLTQRKGLWYACDDEGVTLVEAPNQWLLNNEDFTPYMYMFKTTIQDLNNAHPSDKGMSALEQMSDKDCESVHDCTFSATEHMSNMFSDSCTGQESRRGDIHTIHVYVQNHNSRFEQCPSK